MPHRQLLRIAACVAVGTIGSPLLAQLPQAGDRDPSGRVMTKIVVTMTEPNSFGHPISGVSFLIVSENGDRISVRTNDAGVASSWMMPAAYRIVNPNPVEWTGRAYTWDIVTPVKAGMGVIRLSQENATKVNPLGEVPSASMPITTPTPSAITPAVTVLPSAAAATAQQQKLPPAREGFWFNLGLGYGVLSCQDCDSSTGGLSGNLSLGGTISPRFLLGVGTTGWFKSEQGVTLSVGTLDARARFYPSATGNFFLTGGIGAGSINLDVSGYGGITETGFGLMLGLGYDFRVGKNVSITPFWNGIAVQTSDDNASVGQIGVGFTLH